MNDKLERYYVLSLPTSPISGVDFIGVIVSLSLDYRIYLIMMVICFSFFAVVHELTIYMF
jgi:hypothetical protein